MKQFSKIVIRFPLELLKRGLWSEVRRAIQVALVACQLLISCTEL